MPHKKTRKPLAISGEGGSAYEEEFRLMGQLLRRDAEQIMERWFERANEEQGHENKNERVDAMNDLLHMLRSIGRRLQEQSSQALAEATDIARDHGRQRAGLRRPIVHVVKDYKILHEVVLEHLGETFSEKLSYRQAAVLAAVMDSASGSAVDAFSQLSHQRLELANRELETHISDQQAELRQLTLDLTDAEHKERHQIAKTLHDDFQQILVATRMKLDLGMRSSPPSLSAMEEARHLVEELLEISRNVTTDLHPTVLERESLPAAIQWLGATFQKRYGLVVTVESRISPESEDGPLSLRRLVYDVVRELLFNVVKHAQTDQAWVRISNEDDAVWKFEIEDRGAGSSDMGGHEAPGKTSLGATTVRRRIAEIGGTMEVDSKPGRGTLIVFTVPLKFPPRQG